ncbi:MAG: hydantoinase/oxoprolinase family protein [Hyphomicrobiales bacterium]
MSKRDIILGIDTGGTYTDAAVIDASAHRILATAKAITTKGDLAVGVGEAMQRAVAALAGDVHASDVRLVCVSTTLATNAVVEGHGNPAGLILIGFDEAMTTRTGVAQAFPGLPVIRVAGGHDHNGDEREKLDEAALEAAVREAAPKVSAFAIAASFAVRNNGHELRARDIVSRVADLPVTISSELSTALDAPRRALTALLNARLVSRITGLIEAAGRAMQGLGISAGLMIVKGDGTLASAAAVAKRPIETLLSGPSASLIGAKWLSGLEDFIMSDMGGTTTDVGVLLKGRPQVAPQGAEVGGWRTMVKAIDVKTIGLGGDSEVQFDGTGQLQVGPQRAVPLSLMVARYPQSLAMLEGDLTETEGGSLLGRFVLPPFGGHLSTAGISDREADILARIKDGPLPLRKLAPTSVGQRAVNALRRKGLVQLAAFTPSDAAIALGLQDNWPRPAALAGARLMQRFRTMKMPDEEQALAFCKEVWSKTVSLSCSCILETAMGSTDKGSAAWKSVCEGRGTVGLARVSLSPSVPIVAVGGPVKVYYPEVARRLACDVTFAPFCDVANAVGAAAGQVADRVVISVEGDGNGAFRVHGAGAAQLFVSGAAALAEATRLARELALAAAIAHGAQAPRVDVTIEKNFLPDAKDDEGLLTATVTGEAIGQPAG